MEKNVVKELCKNFKLYEKIIIIVFKKIFIKVYNVERIYIINALLK